MEGLTIKESFFTIILARWFHEQSPRSPRRWTTSVCSFSSPPLRLSPTETHPDHWTSAKCVLPPHCFTLIPLVGTQYPSSRSKVTTVGDDCDLVCVDPSLPWMERLYILLRQLQCPLLLVKVMILPHSPAVHLFISLPVLPSYKAYLTSISVMESGASGSCLATTRLPASPLLLQHTHRPTLPAELSRFTPAARFLTKCFIFAWMGRTFFLYTFYLFADSHWCLFVLCWKDYMQQNQ